MGTKALKDDTDIYKFMMIMRSFEDFTAYCVVEEWNHTYDHTIDVAKASRLINYCMKYKWIRPIGYGPGRTKKYEFIEDAPIIDTDTEKPPVKATIRRSPAAKRTVKHYTAVSADDVLSQTIDYYTLGASVHELLSYQAGRIKELEQQMNDQTTKMKDAIKEHNDLVKLIEEQDKEIKNLEALIARKSQTFKLGDMITSDTVRDMKFTVPKANENNTKTQAVEHTE